VNRRQRRILGVAGCGVLLVALVAGVGAWRSRGNDDRTALAATVTSTTEAPAAETTTAPEGPTTTYALVPVTTGVPVPNATEAPPATDPPSATPAAPGTGRTAATAAPLGSSPALTANGAVLTAPANPGPARVIDKAKGCYSAADAGWKVTDCGALKTKGIVLLWLVEAKGNGRRALVLREQTADQWTVVLSAADDAGTSFSAIGVHGDDVSGDGQPDLAFGFHRRTPDKALAVDVVEGPGAVTLHRELPGGSARTASGRLDTWAAKDATTAQHDVVQFASGAWRVTATDTVDPKSVPASMI
jgi:hypothetical protein